jgi:hypothetical protein
LVNEEFSVAPGVIEVGGLMEGTISVRRTKKKIKGGRKGSRDG